MHFRLSGVIRRSVDLISVVALLYAMGRVIHVDVLHRAVSILASAVWGS
jgi:hypothetical protein